MNSSSISFTVVDALDQNPVDSVTVIFHGRDKLGLYFSEVYATDARGKCSMNYDVSSALLDLTLSKEGYVTTSVDLKYSCPGTVTLVPAAVLKLHVKNVPPTDAHDLIAISFLAPSSNIGGLELWLFEGANVDDIKMGSTLPGHNSITCTIWHDNVRKDSTLGPKQFTSRETTFVEILY